MRPARRDLPPQAGPGRHGPAAAAGLWKLRTLTARELLLLVSGAECAASAGVEVEAEAAPAAEEDKHDEPAIDVAAARRARRRRRKARWRSNRKATRPPASDAAAAPSAAPAAAPQAAAPAAPLLAGSQASAPSSDDGGDGARAGRDALGVAWGGRRETPSSLPSPPPAQEHSQDENCSGGSPVLSVL